MSIEPCQLGFALSANSIQGSLTEGDGSSTVDLLIPTSLDQLVSKLKIVFSFFTKQATFLMRRPTVLSLPPQLVFPDAIH